MLAIVSRQVLNSQMNNTLTPITEVDSLEASRSLLVSLNLEGNQRLLRSRNFGGVLQRYGDNLTDGQRNFEQAQELHATQRLGAFVVRNSQDELVGMATIYPQLGLKKLMLPLPPVLARGPVSRSYEYDANISAWAIGPNGREVLRTAYKDAATIAMSGLFRYAKADNRKPFIWTVEPTDSPHFHFVDKVIREAGLTPENRPGLYDDQESRKRIPPISQLYLSKCSTLDHRS